MSCTCGKESILLCDECWGKYLEERIYSDAPQKQDLQSQLVASQKRERILREGLVEYAHPHNWYQREDFDTDGSSLGFTWEYYGNGPGAAVATLKAAEEVKG